MLRAKKRIQTFHSAPRNGPQQFEYNRDCFWTITGVDDKPIQINFTRFDMDTEYSGDHVYITESWYEGDVEHGPFSGKTVSIVTQ